MTELLTAAQMRAIEQAAIASGEVTGLELMERAGRGVVEAVFAEWPELAAGSFRAVVLCGPGGNGGDGFVVARLLKDWGWEVEVFLYGDPETMPPDARVNYERWVGMGEVNTVDALALAVNLYSDDDFPALWVDAIFGIGLSRPVPEKLGTAFDIVRLAFSELVFSPGGHIVAVDVPTGLDGDSGVPLFEERPDELGTVFRLGQPPVEELLTDRFYEPLQADLTVTFHRAKLGHHLGQGPGLCGTVRVKDIGLKSGLSEMSALLEAPCNLFKRVGHKYSHGHALILSGGVGHGGAARLAARGALRIGAGVVTVGCPAAAVIENAAQLNAIMLRPVGDAGALAEVLEDRRINALCLGPGMGVARAKEMLGAALQSRGEPRPTRAVVLDADALTALAEEPDLFAMLHKGCVLTPHAGEFARLFPDLSARLAEPATQGPAYSKVDATREAAARAGCVVLFKGADTVIAAPDGRCSINSAAHERSAPWLATAGSGDVLAGFITGLLARGFSPMHAAETAAWLHVECARSFGPGLIAEDLPEELPKVFRSLGL